MFIGWKHRKLNEEGRKANHQGGIKMYGRNFWCEFGFIHTSGCATAIFYFRLYSKNFFRHVAVALVNFPFIIDYKSKETEWLDCSFLCGFGDGGFGPPIYKKEKVSVYSTPPLSFDIMTDRDDFFAIHGRFTNAFETIYFVIGKEQGAKIGMILIKRLKWTEPLLSGTGMNSHYVKNSPDKGLDDETKIVYKFRWENQVYNIERN